MCVYYEGQYPGRQASENIKNEGGIYVTIMEEKRNACRTLVGKPEQKRPLGTPRRWWEDSIKMDLREIG
jgi:hypothetical protein